MLKLIGWGLALMFAACLVGLLTACTPATTYTNGVPNFAVVEPGVWRSGQPTTAAQWAWLKSLGVQHVVKLNDPVLEGSDDLAVAAGLDVHVLTIQPVEGPNLVVDGWDTLERPDESKVSEALSIVAAGGGVLVHCTHGQDRTSFLIGRHRVEQDRGRASADCNTTKIAPVRHPELVGLEGFWDFWHYGMMAPHP